MKRVSVLVLSLVLAGPLGAQQPVPAEDPWAAWQRGLDALKKGEAALAASHLAAADAAMPRIPDLLYTIARAQALAGRPEKALTALEQAVALGFGVGAETEPAFETIRGLPRFGALLPRIADNSRAVSRSRSAFTIAEPDLIPEGAAWDPKTRTLFVGSLHKAKVVAIGPDGKARDFVRPGQDGLWQVLGMKVDAARSALWVCSAEGDAPGGNTARRSGLFRFDLETGRLTRKYPAPAGGRHLFNDLVVTEAGEVYLTDSEEGSLYRLPAGGKALEVFVPGGTLGYPNGIALSAGERFLYVAHAPGIVVWNRTTGERFPLPAPDNVTLAGIDGLYFHRGSLVAVQNGVEPNRVVAFPLSARLDRVTGCRVLERGNPLFDIPTTGAVAGDGFYFMANTQLTALGPGNVVKEPEKRKPVVILWMELS